MKLSPRELQVAAMVAAGTANKVIAYDLGISTGTVKVHVRHALRKLGVTNRTQLALAVADPAVKAATEVKLRMALIEAKRIIDAALS